MTGSAGRSRVWPAAMHHGIDLLHHFRDSHGVHLAAVVIAVLDGVLQKTAGALSRQTVSDDVAGALLVIHPGGAGDGNPHAAAVDIEAHIDGIGVPSGNGHHIAGPPAVQVFCGEGIVCVEVFVHIVTAKGNRSPPLMSNCQQKKRLSARVFQEPATASSKEATDTHPLGRNVRLKGSLRDLRDTAQGSS